MNEFNSASELANSNAKAEKSHNAAASSATKPKRKRNTAAKANGCVKGGKGRKLPCPGSLPGPFAAHAPKSGRPTCRVAGKNHKGVPGGNTAAGTAVETMVGSSGPVTSPGSEKSASKPKAKGRCTRQGGTWLRCSLTPRVLRAHAQMGPVGLLSYEELLTRFEPLIRASRSHEVCEMIMDRLAIAAMTFQEEAPYRDTATPKGHRSLKSWANRQISFGTRDLSFTWIRNKVREAFVEFVEEHGFEPEYRSLKKMTKLSAAQILDCLKGIREELGYQRTQQELLAAEASSCDVVAEVMAKELVRELQATLRMAKPYDQALWVLRFVLGYGPEAIVELIDRLRPLAKAAGNSKALECILARMTKTGAGAWPLPYAEELLDIKTATQIRCRIHRLNKAIRSRLIELGLQPEN
ncbi:MAG: hypothetical protein JNN07_26985 [Verrucomicrobiales bacterium]|nr:hypothetical protein [Verrucomicrobiales bacterium]